MIDYDNLLDQFPQVSNRGVIKLVPTKLFVDWFNYITNDGINYSIDSLESISFLIHDFDTRMEFQECGAVKKPLKIFSGLNCSDGESCFFIQNPNSFLRLFHLSIKYQAG